MSDKLSTAEHLTCRTPEEFAEEVHNKAMGPEPFIALQARALKQLVPATMKWIDQEGERRTPPGDLLDASSMVLINLVLSVSERLAYKRKGLDVAIVMMYKLNAAFRRLLSDPSFTKGYDPSPYLTEGLQLGEREEGDSL